MGELFQLDTISITELGTAIVNEAHNEKTSTDPLALDNFTRDLDTIVPEMPHVLQSPLQGFIKNFSAAYTDVLNYRADIGDILLGTASEAEKHDVQTVNWFLDTQPKVLIP